MLNFFKILLLLLKSFLAQFKAVSVVTLLSCVKVMQAYKEV